MNRIVTIGALAVFGAMLAGCNQAKPLSQVKQDVANAQAERSADVADARREGNQEIAVLQRDVDAAQAGKAHEIALAKADGDYDVAVKACNALSGSSQTACKDDAAAILKSDKASAELLKP